MNEQDICSQALSTYGADNQTLMVFEEMAELQKALCKHARGENNRLHIAEEIADVQITLAQMVILYDCADEVNAYKKYKLERLRQRLNEEVGKP